MKVMTEQHVESLISMDWEIGTVQPPTSLSATTVIMWNLLYITRIILNGLSQERRPAQSSSHYIIFIYRYMKPKREAKIIKPAKKNFYIIFLAAEARQQANWQAADFRVRHEHPLVEQNNTALQHWISKQN